MFWFSLINTKRTYSNFCCHLIRRYCSYTARTMGSPRNKLVAVCQMTSTANLDENYRTCEHLVKMAKSQGAIMAFLPEACDYICTTQAETVKLAQPLTGPFVSNFRKLALELGIWISLGGVHEKNTPKKVFNCHVIINDKGDIVSTYRKIHTFDAEIQAPLLESAYVEKGSEIVRPCKTPIGNLGLAICYDVRFSEISLSLTEMGADILTYPSAFTFETGSLHWETLLRSRAIENQCYVIAAAQTGKHPANERRSWGHAMIVDPYGLVTAQCSDEVGIAISGINEELITKIRSMIPVSLHRRFDVYPKLTTEPYMSAPPGPYQFGQVYIEDKMVFYQTRFSLAFVNKRCVVPGHVLVIPMRPVKRLGDLCQVEIADLFLSVQKVQKVMEKVHDTSSSTVVIQDGPDAGQTIWHVHVHILPRKAGDFADNDDIYRNLQRHDTDENTTEWRDEIVMEQEASFLRTQV